VGFTLNTIEKALRPNVWDYSNEILYNMCSKRFDHKDDENILAKIWIIGRAYAAAIERRKNKKDSDVSESFAIKIVAPAIKKSKIDDKLDEIEKFNSISENNLFKILQVHKYLQDIFYQITELEKRSLTSKYLHFHLPNLFYIYDSRAANKVRSLKIKIPKDFERFEDIVNSDSVDRVYAHFFIKVFILCKAIYQEHKVVLSPRQIDKLLLYY
jgi:hypothetical protein